jgi:dTDP-4-amino-4,6-dideoxygalactose transaminase
MLTTSRADFATRLKLLRQHGMSVNDRVRHESKALVFEDHLELGYNYRMTDIQAAVGIQQLAKLDWIVAERRKIAQRYQEALGDLTCLRLPREPEGCFSNFQSFSVYMLANARLSRNAVMQAMLDAGISTRRGVMTAHRETAYLEQCAGLSLPVSEHACDNSVLLPLYVPMAAEDVETVIRVFRSLLS